VTVIWLFADRARGLRLEGGMLTLLRAHVVQGRRPSAVPQSVDRIAGASRRFHGNDVDGSHELLRDFAPFNSCVSSLLRLNLEGGILSWFKQFHPGR